MRSLPESVYGAQDMLPALECLLFVAGEPLALKEIQRALQLDESAAELLLRDLQIGLTERGSGLQLIRIANGWQLSTRPEHSETVGRLLARRAGKLSRAALEVLAMVAYRQPITCPEIESVRGVSCDGVIKTLTERGLIEEVGRKQAPGRPALYATTSGFLHYFGIHDLSDLPALEEPPQPNAVPAEEVTDGVASRDS